jgi:hypothetical protein
VQKLFQRLSQTGAFSKGDFFFSCLFLLLFVFIFVFLSASHFSCHLLSRYLFWPWSERIMPFLSETNPVLIDQLKERILILQQLQQNPATQEPNEDLLQVMRRESNSNNQTQYNQGTTTSESKYLSHCFSPSSLLVIFLRASVSSLFILSLSYLFFQSRWWVK